MIGCTYCMGWHWLYESGLKCASTVGMTPTHWVMALLCPAWHRAPPVESCDFCGGTPHAPCPECFSLHCAIHASDLCQSEVCVGLRQCVLQTYAAMALVALALAVGELSTTVANPLSTHVIRPKMLMHGKEFSVLEGYPKNASRRLAKRSLSTATIIQATIEEMK